MYTFNHPGQKAYDIFGNLLVIYRKLPVIYW